MNSNQRFWLAFDKRDFKELEKYSILSHNDICAETLTFGAIKCLKNNDLEMLNHIHFPIRMVMEDVANDFDNLERLLSVLLEENYRGDIPDYVWKKATSKTKKLLKNFEKERSKKDFLNINI